MDKKKINLILAICLMILGILSICVGLLDEMIPHELRLVLAVLQIIVGAAVIYITVLKIKGKF